MTRRLLTLLPLLLAACAPKPAPRPAPSPTPAPTPAPLVTQATVPGEPPTPPARIWREGRQEVPVIMYHDVCAKPEVWFDLTTPEFERQMALLRERNMTVVPLADVVDHLRDGKPLPKRAVALTFDQGCLGNLTDAWPILRRYGYPATFFVHTDFVGKKTSKQHLTWEQLKTLVATGQIDVQPQSCTFPEFMQDLPEKDILAELRQSRTAVEKNLGTRVRFYAHPYGNGDDKVAKALEELGYEAAWNEVRAPNASPADRFFLPRYAPKRLGEAIDRATRAMPGVWSAGPLKLSTTGAASAPAGLRLTWDALDAGLGRALRRDGRRQPMGEGEQLGLLATPMVVVSAKEVLFCRFGGWMNPAAKLRTPGDPLATLLPGATNAGLGRDWAIHEGKALAGEGSARALVGITAGGRLFTLRAPERATRAKLTQAALGLGAVEGVTF
ncbi:MAG: polysaccharide deacetylase family protein [Armatimonadetes bacterium]|nr:polysaccharide deacetylase family protein [Armatimonadota bacterium]